MIISDTIKKMKLIRGSARGLYITLYLLACYKTDNDIENGNVEVFGAEPTHAELATNLMTDAKIVEKDMESLVEVKLVKLNPLRITNFKSDNNPFIQQRRAGIARRGSTIGSTNGSFEGSSSASETRLDKTIKDKSDRFPTEAFNQLYLEAHLSGGIAVKQPSYLVETTAHSIWKRRGWQWLEKEMRQVGGKGGSWSWIVNAHNKNQDSRTTPINEVDRKEHDQKLIDEAQKANEEEKTKKTPAQKAEDKRVAKKFLKKIKDGGLDETIEQKEGKKVEGMSKLGCSLPKQSKGG